MKKFVSPGDGSIVSVDYLIPMIVAPISAQHENTEVFG